MTIAHGQGELLAQVKPAGTLPVLGFSAGELRVEITLITCVIDPAAVLATAGETDVAVYHDDDGTVYDDTNLIINETRLLKLQDTILFQAQHPGSGITLKPGGSLGVESADADAVTFSIYGITETRAERIVGR